MDEHDPQLLGRGAGRRVRTLAAPRTQSQGAATAKVSSRLADGDVPPYALDLALAGRLQGRAYKDGGTRVLACMAMGRRMVARAVYTLQADSIKTAVSTLQHGIGLPAGLETLHKSISAEAEQSPDLAVISLDFKSAFTRIRRQAVLRRVRHPRSLRLLP